jgi:diguanylate cyclase
VLLAWIDAPTDGERVAKKLVDALHQPFSVAGNDLAVTVHAGLALYPEHGKTADLLLRRSVGQASSLVAMGAEGIATAIERGRDAAANDT